MSFTSARTETPAERGLELVIDAMRAAGPQAVLLIDGPSGAGKSTFADRLCTAWGGGPAPQLVRMDDIYPGWHGLDRASATVVTELLAPRAAGLPAGWRRWDWVRSAPAEWNVVDPDRPLILEGCGTLSRRAASLAQLRVWITADDTERKQRALARDNGGFDAHWDQWDADFSRYLAREDPLAHTDLVLDGGGLAVISAAAAAEDR